jgi:DNA invertase Pin-like site-specific DNA recombinase
MGEQKQFRCAVYTRKSSEEGLEQDFNSLEAQREACEAYVRSQSHEGWRLIADRFDDGGFSGGNMNRPGLEQLMALVRAGKVDVIVIYKIDRLTRSLTDFARLAEVLDQHGVSFVSVTQQFNTTTSMGRLMLNVLLSFAQFEREITGERIRDKIAASKKKGMWMGGNVPMGYDVKDRHLLINETDAAIIRSIFASYLDERTVPALLDRLDRAGVRTSSRLSAKGKASGGRPFTRGHLYKLLSNPIYIGRVPHKTTSHPGLHQPIIDRALWDQVQAQLGANTQGTRNRRRRAAGHANPLAGLLYSEAGNRFTPSQARKGSRQYRYYVEDLPTGSAPLAPTRLPATEIEAAALAALGAFLSDRQQVWHDLDELSLDQTALALEAAPGLVAALGARSGQTQILRNIVVRVTYRRDTLALRISRTGLLAALKIPQPPVEWPGNAEDPQGGFVITAPLIYRRRGVQAKLTIGGGTPERRLDKSLQENVARAHGWLQQLAGGERRSIAEIAAAENITGSKVTAILDLAFLAPDLVEGILAGTQLASLSATRLIRDEDIPARWVDQRARFRSG